MRRRTARLPVTLLAFFFRQLATLVGMSASRWSRPGSC